MICTIYFRHPRESGDPGSCNHSSSWIPAFAGMTVWSRTFRRYSEDICLPPSDELFDVHDHTLSGDSQILAIGVRAFGNYE